MSNIYYWEKMTISKLVGKVDFSERKSFVETLISELLSSAVFHLQNCVSDFFNFVLLGR